MGASATSLRVVRTAPEPPIRLGARVRVAGRDYRLDDEVAIALGDYPDLGYEDLRRASLAGVVEARTAGAAWDTGVMAALFLPPEAAAEIAVPGGEPAERLHITLAFISDDVKQTPAVESEKGWDWPDLSEAVAKAVEGWGPFEGTITGGGHFAENEETGEVPWWAHADVPQLHMFVAELQSALLVKDVKFNPNEHGWTPHITLKYATDGEDVPLPDEPVEVRFDHVVITMGKSREEVPLTGPSAKKAAAASRGFEAYLAGVRAREGRRIEYQDESPLEYDAYTPARLSITDDEAPSAPPGDSYFPEGTKTVAFADHLAFQDWKGRTGAYIAYVNVRRDQRGKGHARTLVDEIYRRHPGEIDFGEIMEPAIGKLYHERKEHPEHGERTRGKIRYRSSAAEPERMRVTDILGRLKHGLHSREECHAIKREERGSWHYWPGQWAKKVDQVSNIGVQRPIHLVDDGEALWVKDGNHRFAWAVEAGLKDVPVKVETTDLPLSEDWDKNYDPAGRQIEATKEEGFLSGLEYYHVEDSRDGERGRDRGA